MSVEIGSERGTGTRRNGDDVHSVTYRKRNVGVSPCGRPLKLSRHQLTVEQYTSSIRIAGHDGNNVVEIYTILQQMYNIVLRHDGLARIIIIPTKWRELCDR